MKKSGDVRTLIGYIITISISLFLFIYPTFIISLGDGSFYRGQLRIVFLLFALFFVPKAFEIYYGNKE